MQSMQLVYSATSPQAQPNPPQRASAACKLCRAKKVRCDAKGGKRCSNCAFDNTDCVLLPRKARKARKANWRIFSGPSTLPKESSHSITRAAPERHLALSSKEKDEATAAYRTENGDLPESGFDGAQLVPLESPSMPGAASQTHMYSQDFSSVSHLQPCQPSDPAVPALPAYIKPLPPTLDPDDIEYLQKKGALTIVESALRDDCLRCYISNVHPLYPIVDHAKVYSAIHGSPERITGGLSLLLLQAMIFAGSMWADVRLVRRSGFLDRKSLRQTLHQRIRFLYDADYEDDQYTLVQSLLLWSFWWKGQNLRKDGWHWIGTAYSIARTLDLHHSQPEAESKTTTQRQRRRLWWALHTREVIGSFGMSRAPRIKETDHDVPMLHMDDFSYQDWVAELSPNSSAPTEAQHTVISRLTIEFVKLNQIFGKILSVACPENSYGRTAVLYSAQQMEGTNNIVSRRQININDLNAFEEELTQWCKKVPTSLGHTRPLPLNPSEWYKIELCHRGMLWMIFHVALMTIHRPQMLSFEQAAPSPSGRSERNRRDASRTIVRHTARIITEISMDFYRADLLTSLSATIVSCLMPVSIQHTFDMFSEDANIRSEASRQLDECTTMLHTLSEQQFAPAWILQTVEHIMSQAKRHRKSNDPLEPACRGLLAQAEVGTRQQAGTADPPLTSFVRSTESVPMEATAAPLEWPVTVPQAVLSDGNPEWMPFSESSYPWPESQDPSVTDLFGLDASNNLGALEEMWLDFAAVSEGQFLN